MASYLHQRDDPMFNCSEHYNSMTVSWITHTLSPKIMVYIDNIEVLWDELCHLFTKGTHFKLSDILQEIHSMKQEEQYVNEFLRT